MNAYLPHDAMTGRLVAATLVAALLAGFTVTRIRPARRARVAAWLLTAAAVAGVERLCAAEPAGVRMAAIIAALLFGMKAVVTVEARADGDPQLSAWRWFAFAAGWPGMRPAVFERLGRGPLPGAARAVAAGAVRLLAGSALVVGAWFTGARPGGRLPATALLLCGLSLILHFGIFNILTGLWRAAGADCRPPFRAPLLSHTLAEFWGRRWNLPFSEMTAVSVYRPLAPLAGKRWATASAFLFSGLLHELAISLPVRAGFGLPLLYFALHGGLVLLERRLEGTAWAVTRWGWAGRVWTFGWLLLPLPLLFHVPFLAGVVWPLIGLGSDG